jgi:alpha-tubulin suppressor-like RCC1 family protein
VQPPQGATQLGTLVVNSGQTLTLASGSYVASSLTLNSNSSLVVSSGPVFIWVTGAVVVSGSMNASGLPASLQLLVTDSDDVDVNSGATIHGIIYAPAAHVNLNASVYGSIVGDEVSIFNSGAAVHYDENEACAFAAPSGALLAAGAYGTCSILPNGGARCWGDNDVGQLGNGTFGNTSDLPVTVQNLTGVVSLTQGAAHACALLSNGTVECWGDNSFGELGVGTTSGPEQCPQGSVIAPAGCSTTPMLVPGLTGVVSISAGGAHTCAVMNTGGIQCWGENSAGELGDGTTTERLSPVLVTGIGQAKSVSAGQDHTCAILSGGTIECWGDNALGALGDGTTASRSLAAPVTGISNATSVSAGFSFTCASLASGRVECWGTNAAGQLGDGTTTGPTTCDSLGRCSPTPVQVSGISNATLVGASGVSNGGHACALTLNAGVDCWGNNDMGQLGNGTTNNSSTPVVALPPNSAAQITVGGIHSCALLVDGTIECWGSASEGQLGNGSVTGPQECPNALNACSLSPIPVQ